MCSRWAARVTLSVEAILLSQGSKWKFNLLNFHYQSMSFLEKSFKWDQAPFQLYTRLGNSGLKISRVILGCMSFGKKSWSDYVVEDEEQVFEIMKKAYDSGIRTFDTAGNYSNGYSEILVGKFLKKYNIDRRTIVIFTKCYFPVSEDPGADPSNGSEEGVDFINRVGLSRKAIFDAVDKSVERLGTYIDLLQIHRYDRTTPAEETMEALHDVVKSGKALYIGASSMRAYQFIRLQNIAERHGWTKFVSMQSYYSLLYRDEEDELIAYCHETGVGLIPWSPLAAGVLARPAVKAHDTTVRSSNSSFLSYLGLAELTENDIEVINRVEALAAKHKVSMATVATAWILAKGQYPILGINKPERLGDALAAISLKLSEEEVHYLEEAYGVRKLPALYH
ncbi:hypothetical protein KL928_000804 [Ogataea angusta]|uniref:NADP-dependent oxidoreductase domain-containing protein n=1 Tax=Pichia angusta TaxID=870730 RepID=A0AAN6DJJ5_PICAN|nr:uncharacterized protein KL928_000804 [Ogataea angusta]KAG7820720.1 hypothetical protein KL928_000804 [Ogataea angusta]